MLLVIIDITMISLQINMGAHIVEAQSQAVPRQNMLKVFNKGPKPVEAVGRRDVSGTMAEV